MAKHPTAYPSKPTEADDLLNDEFHRLLREAAEQREVRATAESVENVSAAGRESADLLALARGRGVDKGSGKRSDRR
jgi:hypothetical protein